ncbi:hypothetical protein J4450_07980 [Candidatus Micrarchaeota archaeon]|nr:hypothetical protein [Candidatus Micrarchaeota archaeon]
MVMDFAVAATVISAIILVTLLVIYLSNYRKIKSTFCTGLIIFAILLLVQNVAAIYFQINMSHQCSYETAQPFLILNFLEAIGLGALLYVTWKPCK